MIRKLNEEEDYPWSLLLDADPDKAIVEGYLYESQVLVYEEDKRLIGIVVFQQHQDGWEVMNLAVASDCQNRGIGRQLLQAVESTIVRVCNLQSPITLWIKTGDISSSARSLYQRQGFVVCSRQKDYFIKHYAIPIYEDGQQLFDQITMVKTLTDS